MTRPIITVDFETDPFKHGSRVFPFAVGIYDGSKFVNFWGANVVQKLIDYLDTIPPSVIYMHNGGRFDIFYIIKWLSAKMTIISGRIVKAELGKHEVRDSYAIIPVALSQYKKDDIDINKLHRDSREKNKKEIVSYLRGDCVYLHELVVAFREEFGDYLTIGSAAMAQLKKFHPFMVGGKYFDDIFRKQFFFGGRVQCFQSGELEKPFSIYDLNSAYPYVMANMRHPNANVFEYDKRVGPKTAFVVAEGRNLGAFPIRNKEGGIDFECKGGTFAATIHEWNAALDTKTFRPTKVLKCYNFDDWIVFDKFVDHFYTARQKAKAAGNKILDLFYKLILNSAYGKFAQNPDNFADWAITQGEGMGDPWEPHFIHNEGQYIVWKKPVIRHSYYNVAIGASITGGTRSLLLRGIAASKDLIYCDTDSLMCKSLDGMTLDDKALGAWKLEAQGTRVAIAGKKLYACMDGSINGPVEFTDLEGFKLQCIKRATKGARIAPGEIVEVARGGTVTYKKDAPTFRLDGTGWSGPENKKDFISRNIRRTV